MKWQGQYRIWQNQMLELGRFHQSRRVRAPGHGRCGCSRVWRTAEFAQMTPKGKGEFLMSGHQCGVAVSLILDQPEGICFSVEKVIGSEGIGLGFLKSGVNEPGTDSSR